jgi:ribosome maturation factor RimP
LRITIDNVWQETVERQDIPLVTVEDCEKVNRQLMFALEVEAVEYKRLEVSSPGIDRPLRTEKDFLSAIAELEIDESGLDNEFEDESQVLDEVRGFGSESGSSMSDDEEF